MNKDCPGRRRDSQRYTDGMVDRSCTSGMELVEAGLVDPWSTMAIDPTSLSSVPPPPTLSSPLPAVPPPPCPVGSAPAGPQLPVPPAPSAVLPTNKNYKVRRLSSLQGESGKISTSTYPTVLWVHRLKGSKIAKRVLTLSPGAGAWSSSMGWSLCLTWSSSCGWGGGWSTSPPCCPPITGPGLDSCKVKEIGYFSSSWDTCWCNLVWALYCARGT